MENMLTEEEKDNPVNYLPYDLPYMTDELKERALLELFEDENTINYSLKTLRSMLTDESLQKLDEEIFLLAFLRTKKLDVIKALNCMKAFCAAKKKHKELFQDFKFSDVLKTFSENSIGFFPYRDEESSCLLYLKLENWNPSQSSLGQILRAVTCGVFYSILSPSTQVAGVKIIVDFKGFGLSKLPYMSLRYLRLFVEGIQNALPFRVRAIFIVNENHFVPYLWFVCKQTLSKKMRNRFHFCGKDMTNFHKYISPRILPTDLDGYLPPFNNSQWVQKVSSESDFIMRMLCDKEKNKKKQT